MGDIVTFYSYKGGVGRTMALANVAALLARWGYKVLAVDWDLEAPGLEQFFAGHLNRDELHRREGVIDLLERRGRRTEGPPRLGALPDGGEPAPGASRCTC